ncbi:type VI secretion system-associated FHA domain protein TagH [Yoonia sediminilitoris]|uniref:FHA domain protein n=1 Tax=Yoonia sediminilitoris TaxID=1286148 RepID=A0A2T6KM33_9RHOB|nr:type VI secretion system-associated FHA domain protein TagH [Yoonia sediminilitoris]PUB17276.1 FHA domain protein [Yoonia sediminilitoris]RCW97571.1 FHA domain protein [Yoonia sediminilitoris]
MTLATIVLEHSPYPQRRMTHAFAGGTLVIGRGDTADWELDDPDQFLSRKHCIIAEQGGQVILTDASRAGTFVDGSETALGTGESVTLEDGMRLKMGDFVFRVDMVQAAAAPSTKPATEGAIGDSGFVWAPADAPREPTKRPDTLPKPFDPFDTDAPAHQPKQEERKSPKPFGMDDPFEAFNAKPDVDITPEPPSGGGGYFGTPINAPISEPKEERKEPPKPAFETAAPIFEKPQADPVAEPVTETPPTPLPAASDAALRAAFLNGLGVDPDRHPTTDPLADMEAMGRQYRLLVEGVMHLLRARASAKQQVRVAQTLVSSANMNPLKFMATTDDAVETLIGEDRPGYLSSDEAITGAYRDLMDHQMRTWSALQSALRRMIDQFDPKTIEAEIADSGMLQSLLAGGKSAQLWQAYEERYRDIASAAEARFLGEVGENFRDAYEGSEENKR